MGVPFGKLFVKAFTWLVPRVVAEVQKEINTRLGGGTAQPFAASQQDAHQAVRTMVNDALNRHAAGRRSS